MTSRRGRSGWSDHWGGSDAVLAKGVVTTVPIDFPTVFSLGAAVALAAKRQIDTEQTPPLSRYVGRAAVFGLAFGLSVGWFCFRYPDWMWVYGLPIGAWSVWWWYPAFVVGLALAAASGALITQSFLARGRPSLAWLTALAGVWILVVFWSVTWEQYNLVSTYQGWHADPRVAVPLDQAPGFGTAMTVVGVIQGALGLYLIGGLLLEARKIPRP